MFLKKINVKGFSRNKKQNFIKYLFRSISGLILRLIPVSFITFVYGKLCKVSFLKKVINAGILKFVPESVVLSEGFLYLNKADPIVSGSIAFGFYEQEETEFFREKIKPGMTVVDVGANIGYFTLIMASKTGKDGRVIAFEPEPENFSILKKNIAYNFLDQVVCRPVALGDAIGFAKLFLSKDNKGDHHVYSTENENRDFVNVPVQTMDSQLEKLGITKVDVMKIDVQGSESAVLEGMKKIIEQSPDLVMLVELWPYGLRNAGADPLVFLTELSKSFEIFEMHTSKIVTDFHALLSCLPQKKYTNILCKRK